VPVELGQLTQEVVEPAYSADEKRQQFAAALHGEVRIPVTASSAPSSTSFTTRHPLHPECGQILSAVRVAAATFIIGHYFRRRHCA
jgi:hypothetical protein